MNKISHPPARPFTLQEALQLLRRDPDSIILAGSTHRLSSSPPPESQRLPPPPILSLDRIEELRRVSRTDRYLEFGSGVSLQRILQLGLQILPDPLRTCLESVGTPGLRRLATIGGNVMIPESTIGLGLVLATLDGTLELRRVGSSRRLPVARLYSQNRSLDEGELLTRIRIPNNFPTHAVYKRFGSPYDHTTHPLGVCGIATLEKNSVERFVFITGDINQPLVRNRELEADIVGQRVPFTAKEFQVFQERWHQTLLTHNLSAIQIERSIRMFVYFLTELRP
ncbi:FAD binding domain-containing protein [Spirochaeta africana]|uniref:Aerobic-type carbon monoxide dehydrogenase, middle subunit CoxM/CutM-like protein n=1 Tax=Spirochaeta africana (strain ATCC 700263 / DSM 8902 / Z-7692) TaxID=889378 RepID=H9UL67_SPIAZ|nr:FAD binding domain-containing protein [Spirochaeta africana]AFG38260.1 aerobic-type carbon monoxide dehydrogenase, middle subunit CoxM/CutM-like protein [Spirochaeta africana DSM 8902]